MNVEIVLIIQLGNIINDTKVDINRSINIVKYNVVQNITKLLQIIYTAYNIPLTYYYVCLKTTSYISQ